MALHHDMILLSVQLHQEKIIRQIVDKRTLYASQPSDLVLRRQIIKLLFRQVQEWAEQNGLWVTPTVYVYSSVKTVA